MIRFSVEEVLNVNKILIGSTDMGPVRELRFFPSMMMKVNYSTVPSRFSDVPLKLFSLEGRYATALYTAANKHDTLKVVESDVRKVKAAIFGSPELQSFLKNPTLSREGKKKSVISLLKDRGYSELTINLFKTMAENGRLNLTSKIIENFENIMQAHRGEIAVKIVSARELDQETLKSLERMVSERLLGSKQVPKLQTQVDPKILGGIVVEIGDKTIDLSVLSRVNSINRSLQESIYD